MITLNNHQHISLGERRASLQRAINTQPFFNLLEFRPMDLVMRPRNYAAKGDVDKDFYVTEIRSNFGEQRVRLLTEFLMSIYLANRGQSLYRYISDDLLPAAFQSTDNRVLTPQSFQDWQREIMPFLVKRTDTILAKIQNIGAVIEVGENIEAVLVGYYVQPNTYISNREIDSINETLARPIEFDFWEFEVDAAQEKVVEVLNNDRYTRMVLGFGVSNGNVAGDPTVISTMEIFDTHRNIRWQNQPMAVSYFAPRVPEALDVNIYYLPIEYYWECMSSLRFKITNIPDAQAGAGYKFVMLTRTV